MMNMEAEKSQRFCCCTARARWIPFADNIALPTSPYVGHLRRSGGKGYEGISQIACGKPVLQRDTIARRES
ncbi:MAG: hypothetical protein MRZ54_10890 [Clostridiales bacterium]|nr:hypothetical protein [Clostridiales bacterium]